MKCRNCAVSTKNNSTSLKLSNLNNLWVVSAFSFSAAAIHEKIAPLVFTCLSVSVHLYLLVCQSMPVDLSVCICPSVSVPRSAFLCLSFCLSVCLSFCLCLFVWLFFSLWLFVCLSACLCPATCLSVYLFCPFCTYVSPYF